MSTSNILSQESIIIKDGSITIRMEEPDAEAILAACREFATEDPLARVWALVLETALMASRLEMHVNGRQVG